MIDYIEDECIDYISRHTDKVNREFIVKVNQKGYKKLMSSPQVISMYTNGGNLEKLILVNNIKVDVIIDNTLTDTDCILYNVLNKLK